MTIKERLTDITRLASDTNLNSDNFEKKFGYNWNFQWNFNSNNLKVDKNKALRDANNFWKHIVKLYRTDRVELEKLYINYTNTVNFTTIVSAIEKLLKNR